MRSVLAWLAAVFLLLSVCLLIALIGVFWSVLSYQYVNTFAPRWVAFIVGGWVAAFFASTVYVMWGVA